MQTIFFTDGVLANSISSTEGDLLEYVVSSESRLVLETLLERAIRMGIIINPRGQSQKSVEQALERSGLIRFFDPEFIIYSNVYTYQILVEAGAKAGLDPNQSLFVGQDCIERAYALKAGFIAAFPHSSLVLEVMGGGELAYARVSGLNDKPQDERLKRLLKLPVVPLHLTIEERGSAYVITSTRVAEYIRGAGFDVTTFGKEHDPQVSDLYLVHDDREVPDGVAPVKYSTDFLARQGKAHFIVSPTDNALLLALTPDISIEEIHFPDAKHGHNSRLLANTSLLSQLIVPESTPSTGSPLKTAMNATLSYEEVKTLKDEITDKTLKRLHAPYVGDAQLDDSGLLVKSRHIAHDHNARVTEALCRHLKQIGGAMMSVRRHNFTLGGIALSSVEAELPGSKPDSSFCSVPTSTRPQGVTIRTTTLYKTRRRARTMMRAGWLLCWPLRR